MADISNQLHDAVDNILSSYAARCESLPLINTMTMNTKAPSHRQCFKSLQTLKAGTRTTAEVLCSLKRPELGDDKFFLPQTSQPNLKGQSRIPRHFDVDGKFSSTHHGVRERHGTFDTKSSVNDSSGRGKVNFGNGIGEGKFASRTNNVQRNVCVAKEEPVELSSDASSDGAQFPSRISAHDKWAEEGVHKTKKTYTEEIEGWNEGFPSKSWNEGSQSRKEIKDGKGNLKKIKSSTENSMANTKWRIVTEEEKSLERDGREEFQKGGCSKYSRMSFQKLDGDGHTNVETRSEEALYKDQVGNTDDLDVGSDEEEAPVLPREIVKRKLEAQYAGSGGKELKGKGNKRATRAPTKKPKSTQMDGALIKKLEFFKRPKNSVSGTIC